MLKGAVPGAKGGFVLVRDAVEGGAAGGAPRPGGADDAARRQSAG